MAALLPDGGRARAPGVLDDGADSLKEASRARRSIYADCTLLDSALTHACASERSGNDDGCNWWNENSIAGPLVATKTILRLGHLLRRTPGRMFYLLVQAQLSARMYMLGCRSEAQQLR